MTAVQIDDIDIAKLKGFKIMFNKKNNERGEVKTRAVITYKDMVKKLIQKAKYEDVL